MQKELFETGKTVDAAIDSACEKLGCLREDCEWEIIDLPKKGFLGLKNIPAKVRVSIEVPDEKPVKAPRPPQPEVRQQRQEAKPQRPANAQRTEKPQQVGKPQQEHHQHAGKTQPRAAKRMEEINPAEVSEKESMARDYIASILDASGLKADFKISREHGGSYINIVGEGLGMIIGRRGETLDALQYLAGLVANRSEGDYLRLTVDCGDYRIKRKGTLESLAKKLASQVLKTNVSRTLEPMNPFERRIIHATVSEIEGVSSSSIGEEPNRRVVITSPTAKPATRSGYRDNRGDRDNRGERDNARGSYNRNRGPRSDSGPRVESAGQAESGERASFSRDKRSGEQRDGHRDRDGRRDDRRDDRRGGGGRPRQQSQPAPQGPPKQTPESEKTAGLSFGKIEL